MEELEDIAEFDAAVNDGDPSIPWEQAKKDFGLL